MTIRRVVLWGFMACGKTAVGAELARRLLWAHLDFDRAIERREGRSVAEIFAREGEPHFRRLEMEVTRELIGRTRTVFSCGGGWITSPEALRLVPADSLTAWLRVSPDEVLSRIRNSRGGPVRPLLATADPEATVRRLLAEREPLYRAADLVVETDGRAVRAVAQEIESRVRAAQTPAFESSKKAYGENG